MTKLLFVPKGTRYKLTDAEVVTATFVSKDRWTHARANGLTDRQKSRADPLEQERQSFAAEIAFCSLWSQKPQTGYEAIPWDIIVDDIKIDVKHTWAWGGDLAVPRLKEGKLPPDMYALVVGKIPWFKVAGYIWAIDLLVPERHCTVFHDRPFDGWVARQADLISWRVDGPG